MRDDGAGRVLQRSEAVFVVALKDKLWRQLSNEIKASVKVFTDRGRALWAVRIFACTAHKAGEIDKVAEVHGDIAFTNPPALHFKGHGKGAGISKVTVGAGHGQPPLPLFYDFHFLS